MGLQVWLPLNGTFENHGLLGPLTQTTAPARDCPGRGNGPPAPGNPQQDGDPAGPGRGLCRRNLLLPPPPP